MRVLISGVIWGCTMGVKRISIVVALILCCALVLPGTAATIDIGPKRLYAGEKITMVIDGTDDPVPFDSEFFIHGIASFHVLQGGSTSNELFGMLPFPITKDGTYGNTSYILLKADQTNVSAGEDVSLSLSTFFTLLKEIDDVETFVLTLDGTEPEGIFDLNITIGSFFEDERLYYTFNMPRPALIPDDISVGINGTIYGQVVLKDQSPLESLGNYSFTIRTPQDIVKIQSVFGPTVTSATKVSDYEWLVSGALGEVSPDGIVLASVVYEGIGCSNSACSGPIALDFVMMQNLEGTRPIMPTILSGVAEIDGMNAPQASFIWKPTRVVAHEAITFLDTSSGTIDSWEWSFADDGSVQYGISVPHVFDTIGVYNVTLTVNGSAGSDSTTRQITVSPRSLWFTGNETFSDAPPLSVNFTVYHDAGAYNEYRWYFSDGTPPVKTYDMNYMHEFMESGEYTIELIAVNTDTGKEDKVVRALYIVVKGDA